MKLNPDCIRAVLLEVENSWSVTTDSRGMISMGSLNIEHLYKALPDHTKEDIFYSVYNLEQAGYLDLRIIWADGGIAYHCTINHMTYAGHEFLNQIRDGHRWSAIKGGLTAIKDYSLSAISSIAEGVANAAISAYMKEIGL